MADTVEYADDELYGLDLAYALSVHKSQGSEYPAIVLGLLDERGDAPARPPLHGADACAEACGDRRLARRSPHCRAPRGYPWPKLWAGRAAAR
jgi:hypothetical protein